MRDCLLFRRFEEGGLALIPLFFQVLTYSIWFLEGSKNYCNPS